MRKLALVLAVLAMVGMVVSVYCAEAGKPAAVVATTTVNAPKVEKAAVPAVKTTKKGIVKEIKLKEQSIVVDLGKGTAEEIDVAEVKFMKGGKLIKLEEVIVDDKITISSTGTTTETIEVEVVDVPLTTKTGVPVVDKAGQTVTATPTQAQTEKK